MLIEQQFIRHLEGMKSRFRIPLAIALWNGRIARLADESKVTIRLGSMSAARRLMQPSLLNLGEAFVEGEIDVEGSVMDIVEVATSLAESMSEPPAPGGLPTWLARHTRESDKAAVQYHYDVSNDFYAAWLDPKMVYSCAYFHDAADDLATAQTAKLDLICRKLRLAPGQRLLDVGCGWGAMVMHAARHYGVRAVGITLSQQQFDLASARVADAGLAGRVEIRLQDYRDLDDGPFDRISSIGMFEHVGLKQLRSYFQIVHDLLCPGGIALNHGITAADIDSQGVRHGVSEFIDRFVFPDGELPHVSLAIRELSATGLELVDAESLRRHYALTCRHWSDNFEAAMTTLRGLASERQVRIWRVYLAGCAMGFARGWMNIYQLLAVKGGAEAAGLPLTRDYMLRPDH